MSKVDAMQAMREARYAARTAHDTVTPGNTVTPGKAAPRVPRKKTALDGASAIGEPGAEVDHAPSVVQEQTPSPPVETAPEPAEDLCGHRSMNNRLCRRPAGHSEKNHRYN